jgi:hypothetical protein
MGLLQFSILGQPPRVTPGFNLVLWLELIAGRGIEANQKSKIILGEMRETDPTPARWRLRAVMDDLTTVRFFCKWLIRIFFSEEHTYSCSISQSFAASSVSRRTGFFI